MRSKQQEHRDADGQTADRIQCDIDNSRTTEAGGRQIIIDTSTEDISQDFDLLIFDIRGLIFCTDGNQQSLCAVQNPVTVVVAELILMCPTIAELSKLTDQTSFHHSEFVSKDRIPLVPHHAERGVGVPFAIL